MKQRPPQIPGLTYLQDLGAGGYADVYLYQQDMPSRRVAVKVLRETGLSQSILERFRSEANAMATLAHPNIVPVYSAATTADGRPYIVMMYYPRASLSERVRRERLAVPEALQIGIKLASAVETAHRAGLLHRDIKPANVLTDQYGSPGLGDFGIAAEASAADDDDLGVSVPWSPPELLYATAPPSAASDVFSLAATIWHLLAGRSPFEVPGGDNSQYAMMKRIRDSGPTAIGRPDVPTSLDRLLRTAMSKDPKMRPASALDLARSLQSIEQELRLPRTQLVLAEERGHTISRGNLGDATRVQGMQRVDAQGLVEVPETAPPLTGTRHRLPDVHLAVDTDEDTLFRSDVVEEQAVERVDQKRPKWLYWVIGGIAAVGAITVALLVWLNPTLQPRPTETPQPVTQTPDVGVELPPGKPAIVGKVDGEKVIFTWTYANPLKTDTFMYQTSEAGEPKSLEAPTVTIAKPATEPACVWVRVVRASGNHAQQPTKGCVP